MPALPSNACQTARHTSRLLQNYPWWPARVATDPDSGEITKAKKYFVVFFGDNTHNYAAVKDMREFDSNLEEFRKIKKSKQRATAIQEALEYRDEPGEESEESEDEVEDGGGAAGGEDAPTATSAAPAAGDGDGVAMAAEGAEQTTAGNGDCAGQTQDGTAGEPEEDNNEGTLRRGGDDGQAQQGGDE
eukprot:COSAG01_NODE_22464_length_854_cov_25.551941_1_plen_187_part_01